MKQNPSTSRQRGFLSSRQALVLLGLLFMTPAFVAWVMHHSSEQGWRPEGTTNRGSLVHPARPLTMPAELKIADQAANEGVLDLRRAGLNKVKDGLTSLEEINRVTIE